MLAQLKAKDVRQGDTQRVHSPAIRLDSCSPLVRPLQACVAPVAKFLPDRVIRELLGTVLINADADLLNPNGIELRLGGDVLFHSTGEERTLEKGQFLKVNPGETVVISSMEEIDFTHDTVSACLPGTSLMGLITPTTTMMREGISQVATKIDAGFRGNLNWALRNSSTKPLIVQHGEPIFKLTVVQLDEAEAPAEFYGQRPGDSYQGSEGIARSSRRLPADIPKNRIVASSFEKLDPKKQLREAGYPFDHIGIELTDLHGKFELVSSDVRMLKDEFRAKIDGLAGKIDAETKNLAGKIDSETKSLATKLDETRRSLLDRVENMFDRKFLRVGAILIGAAPIMYGGIMFLRGTDLTEDAVSFLAVLIGVVIVVLAFALGRGSGNSLNHNG